MILSLHFVLPALLLSGCTLFHQEQPNTPPIVETTRVICIDPKGFRDTLSANSQCTLNRGGEVELSVFASDQDDDPLAFYWTSYGSGTFRDSLAAQTSWFAPASTENDFTKYVLTLTITDRNCEAINTVSDRKTCQKEDQKEQLSFSINVTQLPPEIYVPTDTTISFHQPLAYLDARTHDPDGDILTHKWYIANSNPEQILQSDGIFHEDSGQVLGSRATFVAPEPGVYKIGLLVSDGQIEIEEQIKVVVTTNESPSNPQQIQQELTLPDGTIHQYEIDVFEYPNENGQLPVEATWIEAASRCAERNQRLCTPAEWQHSCQNGADESLYSSLDEPSRVLEKTNFGLRFCNVVGSGFSLQETNNIAPSGSFPNCHSGNNVFDLTGNLSEWTAETNTFNEWLPSRNISGVSSPMENNSCGSFSFPGIAFSVDKNFDATQIESIKQNSSKFEVEPFEELNQSQTGFRCCR
ncbi:MAG: SUMF1/EgtB/PvdO family nonheme iron enzyme [Candidatus Latescibacterota bacterium]|nr:SUMF1/EgtB/PvdO family nonheme iron enzyme [Candidatus Latescibacterota bacterium]